jgi:hypothetical protein
VLKPHQLLNTENVVRKLPGKEISMKRYLKAGTIFDAKNPGPKPVSSSPKVIKKETNAMQINMMNDKSSRLYFIFFIIVNLQAA